MFATPGTSVPDGTAPDGATDGGVADLLARAGRAAGDEAEELSELIRAVLREPGCSPVDAAGLARALAELGSARGAGLRLQAHARIRRRAAVADELRRLRDTGDDPLAAAAGAALACCPVDRVVVSRLTEDAWTVVSVAERDGADASGLAGRTFALSGEPEGHAVRRRRATLAGDDGRGSAFSRAARSRGYAIAPVIVGGRVPALVHADRGPGRPAVTDDELELVAAFAGGLGFQLDGLRLRRALADQRARIENALDSVPSPRDTLALELHDDEPEAAPAPARLAGPSTRIAQLLTPRELEVMELVAQGLRNAQVAEQLALTEATVKGHVTAIMRKLRVGNRAEAAVRYARLITPEESG